MPDPLLEYFKYASESPLHIQSVGTVSADSGYFAFGSGITCYGRTAVGRRARNAHELLHDASKSSSVQERTLCLPFDPAEVVRNLTHEQYARGDFGGCNSLQEQLARRFYYMFRPLLPLRPRSLLQKWFLRNRHELCFPHWPVDTTVDRLMKKLLALAANAAAINSVPFIWFWPNGHSACSIMTHDVETQPGTKLCSNIMDIDEEFNIPASFQVVPERRYRVTDAFIESLKARSFEVNVQDLNHDGLLFSSYKKFKQRAKRINQYGRKFGADGFRAGVLYRNQDWFELLDFEYDMSVPNVAHLDPQRGGCCTVMPYFVGRILELPVTTTQDHSLLHILNDHSIELWRRQMDLILEQNGFISFIVHPDYMSDAPAQATYKRLLQELNQLRSERNVWMALPGEVNRWWRQRSGMELVSKNGQWTIEGEGSDRARVAFAQFQGDDVVYFLPRDVRHPRDTGRDPLSLSRSSGGFSACAGASEAAS
jgi:hypothetical protein